MKKEEDQPVVPMPTNDSNADDKEASATTASPPIPEVALSRAGTQAAEAIELEDESDVDMVHVEPDADVETIMVKTEPEIGMEGRTTVVAGRLIWLYVDNEGKGSSTRLGTSSIDTPPLAGLR
jgi:hypothetical protein